MWQVMLGTDEVERLAHLQIFRIAGSDDKNAVFKLQRNNAVVASRLFWNVSEHILTNRFEATDHVLGYAVEVSERFASRLGRDARSNERLLIRLTGIDSAGHAGKLFSTDHASTDKVLEPIHD